MSGSTIFNVITILAIIGLTMLRSKANKRVNDVLLRSKEEGITIEQYLRYLIDVAIGVSCFVLLLALKAQGVL